MMAAIVGSETFLLGSVRQTNTGQQSQRPWPRSSWTSRYRQDDTDISGCTIPMVGTQCTHHSGLGTGPLVKSSISSRGSVSLAKNDFLSCRALTITFTWTTKRYGAWAPSESQAAGCTLFSHVLRAGTAGHPRRFRMYVVLVYVCAMYVCTLACMRADACYRCA